MDSRRDILRCIHDVTAHVVKLVHSGDATNEQIVEFVTRRQNLVDALAEFDTSTHDEERALAQQVIKLDQEIARYCEGCRSELAKQLLRSNGSKNPLVSNGQPRIISQRA